MKDATSLEFDLSRFMPMIAAIYPETSDHNFKLTVKDSQSKQTVKTLRFHLTVAEPVDPVPVSYTHLDENPGSDKRSSEGHANRVCMAESRSFQTSAAQSIPYPLRSDR